MRIHRSSSVLTAAVNKNEQPDYLVYSEVYAIEQVSPVDGSVKTNYYMKGVTKVDDLGLINNLASELLL